MSGDRWWTRHCASARPRWRLLCLPHAGAGAGAFARWPGLVPADCEVVAIRLPGRESRLGEPAFTALAPLVAALVAELAPLLDLPFVIFGHSMGALVGHAVVRELAAGGQRSPELLVASGHASPTRPREEPALHDLPPAPFAAALRELGGTPAEVLDHHELFALLETALRADLQVVETAPTGPVRPLAVPVAVYAGAEDRSVTEDGLAAWQEVTVEPVGRRTFTGSHFYLSSEPAPVVAALVADRARTHSGLPPVSDRSWPSLMTSRPGTTPPTDSGGKRS